MKWILVSIIVLATTAGEVLQALGMRHHGEIHDFRPGALGRVASALAQSWHIMASIGAMAVSFFAFMSLISIAELSFAVPASSASFVIETLLAKFVLHERIGMRRTAGTLAVLAGVLLVGG